MAHFLTGNILPVNNGKDNQPDRGNPPGPDGKRVQRWATFSTREEAKVALARMEAEAQELKAAGYKDPGKLTVGDYLDQYLAAVRDNLAPSTRTTKRLLFGYLTPKLGKIPLRRLTKMDIQKAINSLPKHLAPASKNAAFRALEAALKQAFRWDLLPRDLMAGITAPAKRCKQERMAVWTPEEVTRFLTAVKELSKYYPVFVLALATGMRQGEILGLKWDDVDLVGDGRSAGSVTIQRSLSRTEDGKGVELRAPKTNSSRRKIPLDEITVKILKAHRKHQLEERLAAGPKWKENGLVFTGKNGAPIYHTALRRRFSRLCKEVKVRQIRFHDLRHTYATLLLWAGTQVKVVSERLGHASISMTLDIYAQGPPGHAGDGGKGHSGPSQGSFVSVTCEGDENEGQAAQAQSGFLALKSQLSCGRTI